jgi:hypothetical protein
MARRLLIFLALPLIACSVFSPALPTPGARPGDFSVRYDWFEGSLPPPYHYEYTVAIAADGTGTVTMVPDYPGDAVPVWTESFTLDQAALDDLYRQLAASGAFTTRWAEEDDPPVGGSYATTSLTANGASVSIPSSVVPAQSAAQGEIAAAINAQVPQEIWDRLQAQRDAYVAEHGG